MNDELIYVCEICQTPLLDEHHCKAVCPNCGRMFDCSDLPIMRANLVMRDEGLETTPGTDPCDVLPKMQENNSDTESKNPDEKTGKSPDANVADMP